MTLYELISGFSPDTEPEAAEETLSESRMSS